MDGYSLGILSRNIKFDVTVPEKSIQEYISMLNTSQDMLKDVHEI